LSILSGSFIFDFFDEVLKTGFIRSFLQNLIEKNTRKQTVGNDNWSRFFSAFEPWADYYRVIWWQL